MKRDCGGTYCSQFEQLFESFGGKDTTRKVSSHVPKERTTYIREPEDIVGDMTRRQDGMMFPRRYSASHSLALRHISGICTYPLCALSDVPKALQHSMTRKYYAIGPMTRRRRGRTSQHFLKVSLGSFSAANRVILLSFSVLGLSILTPYFALIPSSLPTIGASNKAFLFSLVGGIIGVDGPTAVFVGGTAGLLNLTYSFSSSPVRVRMWGSSRPLVKDLGCVGSKGEDLGKENWYDTEAEEKSLWEHTKETVGVKPQSYVCLHQ